MRGKRDKMNLHIYSIRDQKGEAFLTPFFQKTHGEAERSFRELTKNKDSLVSKYPEDYDLYHIGKYDDQTGVIQPNDTPQHIIKAVQAKES